MKYRYLILPTLLALMSVATSCQQEDLPPAAPENDVIDITAQIGTPTTRIAETTDNVYSFEKDDTVSIIGWYGATWTSHPSPWSDATAKWWINSINVYTGSKWVATPKMRWQNVDEPHHFLAWWPKNFASAAGNLTDVKFDLDKMTEKDILVAQKSTVPTPGVAVPFVFDHLMSRFDVHVKFGEQYTTVSDVELSIEALTAGSSNLIAESGATVTTSATATPNDCKLEEITAAASYDKSFSAIILPQTLISAPLTINFVGNGVNKSLVYNHPNFLFESGKRTTLKLVVGKAYVDVVSVEVTPWEDGGSILGPDHVIE